MVDDEVVNESSGPSQPLGVEADYGFSWLSTGDLQGRIFSQMLRDYCDSAYDPAALVIRGLDRLEGKKLISAPERDQLIAIWQAIGSPSLAGQESISNDISALDEEGIPAACSKMIDEKAGAVARAIANVALDSSVQAILRCEASYGSGSS